MSWSIGYDEKWKRDIGYAVPALCDFPECNVEIDRGLAFVCGGEPFGGEHGCGLYFCGKHHPHVEHHLCERCRDGLSPFVAKQDIQEWIKHKLKDPSWEAWRLENKESVLEMEKQLK